MTFKLYAFTCGTVTGAFAPADGGRRGLERQRGMTRIAALDRRVDGNTTRSSDVLAQARDCFIERLNAAISAADRRFEIIKVLPQGITVSGDIAFVMLDSVDKRCRDLGLR